MSNWERNAIQFITRTSERTDGNVSGDLIPFSLALLQEMTGSYLALQVIPQDNYIARIRNASPFFLEDMALPADAIQEFITRSNDRITYWSDIPARQVFSDILLALSSAMIIPVQQGDNTVLLIFGWSDTQVFDESFYAFATLVKVQIEKILQQAISLQNLQAADALYTTIFNTLSQALVFIDGAGTGGWINEAATTLLQLPQPGRQEAATLSAAMAALRNRLQNREDVDSRSATLFSSPGTALKDWLWQLDTGVYKVASLPVHTPPVSGRLWIFEIQQH